MAPTHRRSHPMRSLVVASLLSVMLPAGRGDAGDLVLVVNTADGTLDYECDAAHCSLADAVNTANREPGVTSIAFAIPADDPRCDAAGVCTIRPHVQVEELIASGVTIDGFTQTGAVPNATAVGEPISAAMKIVLDGALLPACCPSGLILRGAGNRVRGLVIHRFYTGIYVLDTDGTQIDGVFIGTDVTGTTAIGNVCSGISVSGTQGGPGSSGTLIGGPAPQHRNLIGANGCVGIELGASGAHQVQGNYVGTDVSGDAALPNEGDGVYIFSPDNLVGGEAPQAANLIAFNLGSGVRATGGGAVRNTISRNRIRGNGGKGIELVAGGNGMLAAPQIGATSPISLSGTTCPGCAVEVFSAAADEGERYEGTAAADGSGAWHLAPAAGFTGPNLTATATDPQGNTSQFSAPASIVQTATPTPSATILRPTPSGTATPSVSATRTATHSPSPSATHSRSATPTYTASRSPSATATASATATSAPTHPPASPSPSAPPDPCAGDCDGDGAVTIDELLRGVNIALGNQSVDACRVADRDENGRVTIDELVAAVGAALGEC